MISLKARNPNTLRVQHLQKAHFKNYYEMKRFEDEREILRRDHRRSTFLINKEIQELQKTLMDVNLISGYFHEASTAHLRAVSIAFSTCNESKKASKCGYIDLNFESGNSVKSKRMFSQKRDGLGDETSTDCERNLLDVKLNTLTPESNKKCSTNNCIYPLKDSKQSKDNTLQASLSHSEIFSGEFNEKYEDEGFAFDWPSNIAKPDLKSSSSTSTHFTLQRGHDKLQKVVFHKRPAAGMRNCLHEPNGTSCINKQQQDQDSKSLLRCLQNGDGRRYASKAAIKHGLHLLISEYNGSQNTETLNNSKQTDLQEKVSKFVSELSEFKCDVE